MGWEARQRGGRYYTRSKKVGGRVVREYVGTGMAAELAAELDTLERQERERAHAAVKSERDTDKTLEAALHDYYKIVDAITEEALLAAGYHKHKGQWRRRRGKKEDDNRPGKA
ncbi:MAG: hypothetical protein ABFD54_06445 [Armatimonadota bacterium]|nr:hypothetical protein [bacterium]